MCGLRSNKDSGLGALMLGVEALGPASGRYQNFEPRTLVVQTKPCLCSQTKDFTLRNPNPIDPKQEEDAAAPRGPTQAVGGSEARTTQRPLELELETLNPTLNVYRPCWCVIHTTRVPWAAEASKESNLNPSKPPHPQLRRRASSQGREPCFVGLGILRVRVRVSIDYHNHRCV